MKDFRQRKQKNKLFNSTLVLVFLFLVFILLARSAYSSYQKKQKAQLEQNKFEQEHAELKETLEFYILRNERLKTLEGKKEELKKTHNVGEPGETIIHIVESRN